MPGMTDFRESVKNVKCPDCGNRALYEHLGPDLSDTPVFYGQYVCTGCCVQELEYPVFRGDLGGVRSSERRSRFSVTWSVVAGQLLGMVSRFNHREVNIGRTVEVWVFQKRQGTLFPGHAITPIHERKQEVRNKIFFRQLDKAHA
jgi:hypothetical protein